VLVLALYINESERTGVVLQPPCYTALACPLLLFWITRVWMLTHRGQDAMMTPWSLPFAIRVSLFVGALFCLVSGWQQEYQALLVGAHTRDFSPQTPYTVVGADAGKPVSPSAAAAGHDFG